MFMEILLEILDNYWCNYYMCAKISLNCILHGKNLHEQLTFNHFICDCKTNVILQCEQSEKYEIIFQLCLIYQNE